MDLMEKFMEETMSVGGGNISDNAAPRPAPRLRRDSDVTINQLTNDFGDQGFDDYDDNGIAFYYGGDRPLIKASNTRITPRTLANGITSQSSLQVRENDITIFCDGKEVVDYSFESGKRYQIHFPRQPTPTPPEIDVERFIIKTDIENLRLADLVLPLVAVSRSCDFIGRNTNASIYFNAENPKGSLIFGKSLSASLQQVALTLSLAFAGFETNKVIDPDTPYVLYKNILEFLKLTRHAEQQLSEILDTVLTSLNNNEDPEFELIKTAVGARIKLAEKKIVPNRSLIREVVKESQVSTIASWTLLEDPSRVKNVLRVAHSPYDTVVLPIIRKTKDLANNFDEEDLIKLLDVLFEIVHAVNNYFEHYVGFYYVTLPALKNSESASQTNSIVTSISEKFRSCYTLFRTIAPYGFINDPLSYETLQKLIEKAQLHYAVKLTEVYS